LTNANNEGRKARLETQVVEGFLPIYNKMTGRALRIERLGQPPEPDVLCRDERTGEEYGVEVVTAYYDEHHARAEWEKARGRDTAGYQLTLPDREENIRVLAWVARNIRRKARNKYRVSGWLLLVVLTYTWRLYLCQEEKRVTRLRIPKRPPFDEIHLLSQWGELYQLFPERRWLLPKT